MVLRASFPLGPRRPPPCWRTGLLHVWIIEGPIAWLRRASFTLGPSWPPLHGRGAVLRLGTTETIAALARGPPAHLDH